MWKPTYTRSDGISEQQTLKSEPGLYNDSSSWGKEYGSYREEAQSGWGRDLRFISFQHTKLHRQKKSTLNSKGEDHEEFHPEHSCPAQLCPYSFSSSNLSTSIASTLCPRPPRLLRNKGLAASPPGPGLIYLSSADTLEPSLTSTGSG